MKRRCRREPVVRREQQVTGTRLRLVHHSIAVCSRIELGLVRVLRLLNRISIVVLGAASLTFAQTSASPCLPDGTTSSRTLGWCLMQHGSMTEAATVLGEHLAANPTDAEVSYWIGLTAYKRYEKQADATKRRQFLEAAVFHFARASFYVGSGALPLEARTRLDTFIRAVYKRTYESKVGIAPLEEVIRLARVNALPPADFRINANYKFVR